MYSVKNSTDCNVLLRVAFVYVLFSGFDLVYLHSLKHWRAERLNAEKKMQIACVQVRSRGKVLLYITRPTIQ